MAKFRPWKTGRRCVNTKSTAINKDIEIVPGIIFPAWIYNGRIPGPTIRCTEGDRIRIHFQQWQRTSAFDALPRHPLRRDGRRTRHAGDDQPGESFTYEFDAEPFGLHLYHCHAAPLARHIAKGLYGAFIIDPKGGRPPVDHEFVMVMSGFDVDFDDENDFYAVNGIPFHYQIHPIQIKVGETVRIYLVNILEFDLINSFHLHANFFHYYPTGTSLTPSEYTDTIMQTQAQRGILEFSYKYPGVVYVPRPQHRVRRAGLDGHLRSRSSKEASDGRKNDFANRRKTLDTGPRWSCLMLPLIILGGVILAVLDHRRRV